MLVAALTGANAILPDMLNVHRERTVEGVTIVVAPGDGPVTAEAWIGGGLGDERGDDGHDAAPAGMAHLGEHVALATAGARGRGLDGYVTPDATVFRAVAGAGRVRAAIAAIARAACAGEARTVDARVVAREQARIASEGEGVARGVGPDEVRAWWTRSYRAERTTLAVRGASVEDVRAAVAAGWRGRAAGGGGRVTGDGRRVTGRGGRGTGDGRRVAGDGRRACGFDVSRASERERAALAIAAAALRVRGVDADLVATREAVLWIARAEGRVVAESLVELVRDEHAFAWARAAVRVPLAGVETAAGELAAGHHLYGDPAWGARWRAEVATVTRQDVAEAVRTHVVGRSVRAARRAPVPPRRPVRPGGGAPGRAPVVKRATLASGARVVAVRVPGADRVAVRVAWTGGFADEGAAERGVVALLAAAAPTSCGTIDAAAETAALGGELAGVAGRWTFGLRSRWTTASWKDGLAVVAACAREPALDHDVVARERKRLVELATGVARSPARLAFTTYLRARWGRDPLGLDALASPAELASITRGGVEAWWRARYAIGAAVIVVAGDVDPDAAITEVREHFAAPARAPRSAPPTTAPATPALPEERQLFVDGPAGTSAVVVGLPGLAAGDADRRALDGLVAILGDPAGRLRRAVAAAGTRTVRVAAVDGPAAGYVVIELGGVPPADGALAAVEATVRALASDGPTPAEVAVASAAVAPTDEPLALADATARAELRAPAAAPATAAPDAATLQRVAATVLRWDEAMIVTVRPPAMTPGARAYAEKRVPPRRRGRR